MTNSTEISSKRRAIWQQAIIIAIKFLIGVVVVLGFVQYVRRHRTIDGYLIAFLVLPVMAGAMSIVWRFGWGRMSAGARGSGSAFLMMIAFFIVILSLIVWWLNGWGQINN